MEGGFLPFRLPYSQGARLHVPGRAALEPAFHDQLPQGPSKAVRLAFPRREHDQGKKICIAESRSTVISR